MADRSAARTPALRVDPAKWELASTITAEQFWARDPVMSLPLALAQVCTAEQLCAIRAKLHQGPGL